MKLTLNEKAIADCFFDGIEPDYFYPFAALSAMTGLPLCCTKTATRGLAAKGLMGIGTGFDEWTGRIGGRGYAMTERAERIYRPKRNAAAQ